MFLSHLELDFYFFFKKGFAWLPCASVLRSLIFPTRRLFHEHIQRLSKVVTANHRALQIPEVVIYLFKNEHLFSCSLVNNPPSPLLFVGVLEGGPLALCSV